MLKILFLSSFFQIASCYNQNITIPVKYLVSDPPLVCDLNVYLNALLKSLEKMEENDISLTDGLFDMNYVLAAFLIRQNINEFQNKLILIKNPLTEQLTERILAVTNNVMTKFKVAITTQRSRWSNFQYVLKPSNIWKIIKFHKGDIPYNNSVIRKLYETISNMKPDRFLNYTNGLYGYQRIEITNLCLIKLLELEYPNNMFDRDVYSSRRYNMSLCKMENSCLNYLRFGDNYGYPITHKVLLFIFAHFEVECTFFGDAYDQMFVQQLCAKIYVQSIYVAEHKFFAHDWLMEGVALCSIYGFEEFIRRDWLEQLLRIQNPDGNFIEGESINIKKQLAFTDDSVTYSKHLIDVTTSALASAVRFIGERYY